MDSEIVEKCLSNGYKLYQVKFLSPFGYEIFLTAVDENAAMAIKLVLSLGACWCGVEHDQK
jgi:hypothetical protein